MILLNFGLLQPIGEPLDPKIRFWSMVFVLTLKASDLSKLHATIEKFKASRLDYFLSDIEPSKTSIKYGRFWPADHAKIELNVKLKKNPGVSPWKMNVKV